MGQNGERHHGTPRKQQETADGLAVLIIAGIALCGYHFHLYTAAFGLFIAMKQRAIHWMRWGAIIFLLSPFSRKRPRDRIDRLDWALAALLVAGCL
jgi:TRAP-type uncharacterized transport system fused permease subunit